MSTSRPWTIRENLSLAVAVAFYGIMNWNKVIQSLKLIYGPDYHMFDRNLCDVQYQIWLDNLNIEQHITTDPNQVIDPSYLILKQLTRGQDVLTVLQLEDELWEEAFATSFLLPTNTTKMVENNDEIHTKRTDNVKPRDKLITQKKKLFLLIHQQIVEHKHGHIFTRRLNRGIDSPLNLCDIKRRIKANQYECSDDFARDVDVMCTQLFKHYEYSGASRGKDYFKVINEFQCFAINLIKEKLFRA